MDPIGAYLGQPSQAPPSADPVADYLGQPAPPDQTISPEGAPAGRMAHVGAWLAAQGAPPGLGKVPDSSALDDLLDLAKVTGAGASGVVGSLVNAGTRLVGPAGLGTMSDAETQQVLSGAGYTVPPAAINPTTALARGNQATQQAGQDALERYLSQDPGSVVRQAVGAGALAAGQIAPTVAMPLAAADAVGGAVAPALANLAERAPTVARLLGAGAKLLGAGAEGTAFGIGNADPNRPLMDQLGEIGQQAAISAGTAGLVEGLHGAGAALRAHGAPSWLAGRAEAPPTSLIAPTGPPEGFTAAPVEPRLGYDIQDRTAADSAARTLAAVGPDGQAEMDYHRAAGGGFHPTDLRGGDPEAQRALFQAAAEIEGPHRGDIAPTGPVAEASARVRTTDPDVFGDYRPLKGDPPAPPPLTSEELAAFTPGTSGAVESPANAELVAAIGVRGPRQFDPRRYIEPTPLRQTNHDPLPLPELGPGVEPADVADAWSRVSARYPATAARITRIRSADELGWRSPPDAAMSGDGTLWVPPGQRLSSDILFHEITHVLQTLRQQRALAFPEGMGLDRVGVDAAGLQTEIPAYRRQYAALTPWQQTWREVLNGTFEGTYVPGPVDKSGRTTLRTIPYRVRADGSLPELGIPPAGQYRYAFPREEARPAAPSEAPPAAPGPGGRSGLPTRVELSGPPRRLVDWDALDREDSASDHARAGLLAGALGDPELAARTLADPKLRGIGDAIASVAPTLEPLRAGAHAGELAPLDLQPALREAIAGMGSSTSAHPAPQFSTPEAATLASFLRENAAHPDEIGLALHRYAELHLLADKDAPITRDELLRAAIDPAERQRAGQILPLEQSTPVHVGEGERGQVSFRGQRFGTSSPLSRWFTVDGRFAAMGQEMRGFAKAGVNAKDFSLLAQSGRATSNVRDFGAAFDRYLRAARRIDPRTDPAELLGHAFDAGRGDQEAMASLPPDLQAAVQAMRGHLDELSQRIVETPGIVGPAMKETIGANVGSYWTRTFERYTNPDGWLKKVENDPAEKWRTDQFVKWAMGEHPDWTEDNARGYARQLLFEDPQALRSAVAMQQGGVGKQGREGFIRRIGTDPEAARQLLEQPGLPREIDNLLGLHRDPAMSYQIGAMRSARDLEVYDLHLKMLARDRQVEAAGGRPIFSVKPTEDLPLKIGGNGPLKNFHTSPEIAAVIHGTDSVSPKQAWWLRALMTGNGYWKTGVTALNFPAAPMRNLLSWPMQYLAGGHFIPAFPLVPAVDLVRHLPMLLEANLGTKQGAIFKLARALGDSITLADGRTLGETMSWKMRDLRPEIYRLRELGVLGQSTMRADLQGYNPLEHGGPRMARETVRNLGAAWSIEHDAGKHLYFRAERANLAWAQPDLDAARLDHLAALRTRAATPTRSEVIPAVRAMRANPLLGPFPSWHAESIRNTKNNLRLGLTDLADDNPRMKILGAKRLAGLAVAVGVRYGLQPAIEALFGANSTASAAGGPWEDRRMEAMNSQARQISANAPSKVDALRKMMPEYYRNSVIGVTAVHGGAVRYISLSPFMPMSSWQDAFDAALRGVRAGESVDGIMDGFSELLNHYVDPEALVKTGTDLLYNQQRKGSVTDQIMNPLRPQPRNLTGQKIMLEGGPAGTAAGQAGAYAWRNLAPGLGREAERMARASGAFGLSNVNARGKQYNMTDEEASLAGVRFSTLDMNSVMATAGHDLNDAVGEAKRYYSAQRSGSQNDARTALEAKGAANVKYKNAWDQAKEIVEAQRTLGVPDGAIFGNLRRSGLPPQIIQQLLSGTFRPLSLSKPFRPARDLIGGTGMEGLQ